MSNTVTPVVTGSNTPGTPIKVGSGPDVLAISPDGRILYVANAVSNTVTPVVTGSNTPGTPIKVGSGPDALAISPDGRILYVANAWCRTR